MVHRRVAGKVQRESRLTHGRTGRQDDEVRFLPAHRYLVDGRETGGNTAQTGGVLHLLDVVHGRVDDGADLLDVLADIVLDGGEDLGLRAVYQVVHLDGIVIGILQDAVRSRNQVPLNGFLLEDFDIEFHVGGGADLHGQFRQCHGTAHRLQVVLFPKLVADGQQIDGDVLVDELGHRLENHPVTGIVETRRSQLVHRLIDGGGLDQHGTQDGFFDIKSLRRFVSHLKP